MDEMSEGPVAPEVARGVRGPLITIIRQGPGEDGCPKRKRAYHRAIKAKRDLPGLSDFHYTRLMKIMADNWNRLTVKEIAEDSPFLGLLDTVCAPSGEGITVEWKKE